MPGAPRPPDPAELDDVVALIAAQQARPDRRISYVGDEAADIAAGLGGLAPPWTTTARVVGNGSGLAGAVVVEWDEELGRAWIHGPWVAAGDRAWPAAAGALLDAALAQIPPAVTRHEMSGEVAHRLLADLATARGWRASEASHVLVVDAAGVAGWPAGEAGGGPVLRQAGPADVPGVAALHDAEFPDTYASAARLVDGGLAGTRVVLVAEDGTGGVAGYAAGEVHDDGEGFLDYVAVEPAARGHGVGRALVEAATRRLLERAARDRVALTVQDHRAPARALYAALGFRPEGSLVAYRSWT